MTNRQVYNSGQNNFETELKKNIIAVIIWNG